MTEVTNQEWEWKITQKKEDNHYETIIEPKWQRDDVTVSNMHIGYAFTQDAADNKALQSFISNLLKEQEKKIREEYKMAIEEMRCN